MPTIARRSQVLGEFLNPLRDLLTPETARAIADLRADAATQSRIEDLAERHHEGKLSPAEFEEYETLVSGASLIAVLQAKARSVLTRRPQEWSVPPHAGSSEGGPGTGASTAG